MSSMLDHLTDVSIIILSSSTILLPALAQQAHIGDNRSTECVKGHMDPLSDSQCRARRGPCDAPSPAYLDVPVAFFHIPSDS